jgi:hypothetical protein
MFLHMFVRVRKFLLAAALVTTAVTATVRFFGLSAPPAGAGVPGTRFGSA